MTHTLITTCCAEKDPSEGFLPAIERYLSDRINWVYRESQRSGLPLLIFSGKFGLLKPTDPIPWYDHALQMDEVEKLLPLLVSQLEKMAITRGSFYARSPDLPGWKPYHDSLERACKLVRVRLDWIAWQMED